MAEKPAPLGLSTYRWNNDLKSIALLAAFPVLLLTLVGVIFFALGLFGPEGVADEFGLPSVLGTGSALDLALSAMLAWWPAVLGVAAVWVLIGYLFNGAIIRAATGAHPVSRDERPELYNLLENLCISRGMPMPKLYIIDTDVMNAFASGIDQKSYAITVTRGILEALSRDEMEAVLAHELSHIMNSDTKLLIVAIVFTGMISFLSQMLWRSMRYMSFRGRGSRKGGGGVIVLVLISAVAFTIGYVLALLLRFAISRKREYLADAGSVDLTKNPAALIGALRKISANAHLPDVPPEVRQLFIENPRSQSLLGLFETHPPLEARIHVLERLGGMAPALDAGSVPAVAEASGGTPPAAKPKFFGKRPSPWG